MSSRRDLYTVRMETDKRIVEAAEQTIGYQPKPDRRGDLMTNVE